MRKEAGSGEREARFPAGLTHKDPKISPGAEIRIWMIRKNIKATELARDIGVHISAITHFLNGDMSSERIRGHLVREGCPEALLDREWIGAKMRKGGTR